ncbi:MAG: oxygen-insensitive NADPH nitroreductase [Gammaproteobacteria bacterium]|nr:oxygen-insensitive NADPH nitroreductase [Gammaproteobacteria bacterium]
MNPIMQTMLNHRSIRSYQERPIDPDLLEQILGCGQAASSSSFIQAYSVLRVSDPDNRKTIASAAGGQRWVIEAAEFLVLCADLQRVQYACEKNGAGPLLGHTEHFISATVDTALLAQNILLAAESAGLGGVFIGGIRNDPQRVSECLELPDQVYPVCGLCLGWPAQQVQQKPRMPLPAILHQDRYRQQDLPHQVDDYDEQIARYYQQRGSNVKLSNWTEQTAQAIQGKTREHMLAFLQARGFLRR